MGNKSFFKPLGSAGDKRLRFRIGFMTSKAREQEKTRKDIAQAFEFARFLIKNPRMLGKIKNGSEIRLIPASSVKLPAAHRPGGRVQAFSSQTVFHSLP